MLWIFYSMLIGNNVLAGNNDEFYTLRTNLSPDWEKQGI